MRSGGGWFGLFELVIRLSDNLRAILGGRSVRDLSKPSYLNYCYSVVFCVQAFLVQNLPIRRVNRDFQLFHSL
jgi:hypothetical protein